MTQRFFLNDMKSRFIRKIFRLLACAVVLGVAAIAAILIFEREPEKVLPKPEACPVVSNVIETIERVFAIAGDRAQDDLIRLDVRKMTVGEFEKRLAEVSAAATLWTPGEGDWLVIGAKGGCSNTLERVLDRLAGEDTVFSFPEIFANCVGTVGEVRPAFEWLDPDDLVVPEIFVTKEIPAFAWLTDGAVDADIVKTTRQEMRSMQVVRRLVLEGNMLSRQQKEDAAIEKWTNAFRRAPKDTLLLERMDHLRRNAEVFYKVGKYGMACKCYETLVRIKTDDYVAYANLGECLKCLGRKELSEAAFKKSEELRRGKENF